MTVPKLVIEAVLDKLRAADFAASIEDGDWMLSRDLAETPMSMLLSALGRGWLSENVGTLPEGWRRIFSGAVETSLVAERAAWEGLVRAAVESRAA